MKKFLVGLLTVVFLISLSACGEKKVEAVTYSEFMLNFQEQLKPLPEYEVDERWNEDREDGEGKEYTLAIRDKTLDYEWLIKIYCNNKDEVKSVLMMGSEKTYLTTNFALLARYIYLAMELPEMTTDDFYESLKFFEEGPISESEEVGEWWLHYMDGEPLSFTILKTDK